jgi:chemotaxis methyl-accepting protein methylase
MTAARVGVTDDFIEFCRGVQALCRIDLEQYKRAQMERRIRTFAAGRGIPKLPDYLKVLRGDRTELEAFLDRITINVSQLWRNPEQWDVLAKHVLPELAKAGKVRAWSAGCSYGAEAYTLAAVAADAIPGTRIEVRGTDIDERIIAKAKTGRFAGSCRRATSGSRSPSSRVDCASTPATCSACGSLPRRSTSSCAGTPSSTSTRRSAMTSTPAWSRPCGPAAC